MILLLPTMQITYLPQTILYTVDSRISVSLFFYSSSFSFSYFPFSSLFLFLYLHYGYSVISHPNSKLMNKRAYICRCAVRPHADVLYRMWIRQVICIYMRAYSFFTLNLTYDTITIILKIKNLIAPCIRTRIQPDSFISIINLIHYFESLIDKSYIY